MCEPHAELVMRWLCSQLSFRFRFLSGIVENTNTFFTTFEEEILRENRHLHFDHLWSLSTWQAIIRSERQNAILHFPWCFWYCAPGSSVLLPVISSLMAQVCLQYEKYACGVDVCVQYPQHCQSGGRPRQTWGSYLWQKQGEKMGPSLLANDKRTSTLSVHLRWTQVKSQQCLTEETCFVFVTQCVECFFSIATPPWILQDNNNRPSRQNTWHRAHSYFQSLNTVTWPRGVVLVFALRSRGTIKQ